MRRRTVVALAVVASALHEGEAPTTCSVDGAPREALWLIDLPITPAYASLPVTTTPPALKELEGDWEGTMTLASVSSSIKQVETMMAPQVGPARPLHAAAIPASGGVEMTFEAGGSPFSCAFVYTPGRLACDTVVNTHRMHWEGAVTRAGNNLQVAGTWTATHPLLRMSGGWSLVKPGEDVDIELVYVAGKSPKIFTTGWSFGARCIKAKGTREEQDLSKSAAWSGTGTFDPPIGDRVRTSFAGVGANRITITCGDAKRSFPVETVSTKSFARVGDKAKVDADAHGCPACPHTAVGPIISGSPNVLIDGRPAARVGDRGVHAACCGPNTFTITTGSDQVLIDGRPAAKVGISQTAHCGGQGRIIEGAPGGNEQLLPAPRSGSGGFLGLPLGGGPGVGGGTGGGGGPKQRGTTPTAAASTRVPAPEGSGATVPGLELPKPTSITDGKDAIETSLATDADEVKVLRNTLPGAKAPTASAALLPASKLERKKDGALALESGAVVVTTFGGKQVIEVPEGKITLGSQARITRIGGEVEIALLSGSASIVPTSGAPFSLADGSRVRFDAKGPKAAATKMSYEDSSKAFASLIDPKTSDRVPTGTLSRIPVWILAAGGGVFALVVAALVVILATRRPKRPAIVGR